MFNLALTSRSALSPFVVQYGKDRSELNENFHKMLKVTSSMSQSYLDVDNKMEQRVDSIKTEHQNEKVVLETKINALTDSINTLSSNFNQNMNDMLSNIMQNHIKEKMQWSMKLLL